jgi:hypothetical protein
MRHITCRATFLSFVSSAIPRQATCWLQYSLLFVLDVDMVARISMLPIVELG